MSEREKLLHEIAIEDAQEAFNDLSEEEKTEAKEYFDDIVEGKKLDRAKSKKYAEMAKFYATRNRKPVEVPKVKVDKDKILADKAGTGISTKAGSEVEAKDFTAIRQQLL